MLTQPNQRSRSADRWIASGLFLVVLGVYILSSPGRIDIIDGQVRFDVTYNWLTTGRPILADPWIRSGWGLVGRDGFLYSFYGPAASVFSMPLVALGVWLDSPAHETSRFLFSLTSSIFGAGIAVVLFFFYLRLGLSRGPALIWTLASTFATLVWPASTSTFDNAQHAFFALTAVYLGVVSAQRNSRSLAAAGGAAAGILLLYQEYFLIILPALAASTLKLSLSNRSSALSRLTQNKQSRSISLVPSLVRASTDTLRSTFRDKEGRESIIRLCIWLLTALFLGFTLMGLYNHLRFFSYLDDGKIRAVKPYTPLFGNPLAGFSTLLFSPGKSVFLYSPPLLLGLIAMRHFYRSHRELALAILGASSTLVLFISATAFAGGDWCWGPRYLVPLLPLWALTFPFLSKQPQLRRGFVLAVLGTGLIVQVLALSVENQRFFFQRGVNDLFWAEDPWFYFKHSALLARIGEAISLSSGPPSTAQMFNSVPFTDWCTYAILGPPLGVPRHLAPQWMSYFKIYYLPRPWPFWMSWINPQLRPINLRVWLFGLFSVVVAGFAFIYYGVLLDTIQRSRRRFETVQPFVRTYSASGDPL